MKRDNKNLKSSINNKSNKNFKVDIWELIGPSSESIRLFLLFAFLFFLLLYVNFNKEKFTGDNLILNLLLQYRLWIFVGITLFIVYLHVKGAMNSLRKLINMNEEAYDKLNSSKLALDVLEQELKTQFTVLVEHEKALSISEQRYNLALEGTLDGIWDWEVDRDNYYFSSKWKSYFGYENVNLENKISTWENLIHPEDVEAAKDTLYNYLSSNGGIYENTYRLRCNNGEYKWIVSRGKALWDEKGNPIRIVGSHTDITNEILLQEKLRKEKEISESIINNASIIILLLDEKGNIRDINPYGEKLTGFSKQEVIGKNSLQLFVPQEERVELISLFERARNNAESISSHENQVKCKDGKMLDVLWSNSAIYDKEGKVDGIISIGADITEIKNIEKQLNLLAYYDTLTELPNRSLFEITMNSFINNITNENFKFALVYIDIDNFKHINDTLGHVSGDMFLKSFAEVLKSKVEYSDFAARLSGDEFVIIFSDIINKEEVISKIEKVLLYLRKPWKVEEQEFFVTYSLGIAIYPEHGTNLSILLRNADTAMFTIKESTKDNYCIYNDLMQEKTINYISMTNQMRHAIDNEEFVLYYQPQIDLNTGKIIGAEALIRWSHPQRGIIFPLDFIIFAEETGFIHSIGKWALKKAFKEKKTWELLGYKEINMSVNISGKRIISENLIDEINDLLEEFVINSSALTLEITETAIMQDLNASIEVLKKLRDKGIKIALDDFGTGYSSLTYLKKLPIDIVKIDKEFISNAFYEAVDKKIVKTIINLNHELNLNVVAEGIETKEQLNFLKENGCDVGQGFLFSKAIPAEDFEKLLQEDKCYF